MSENASNAAGGKAVQKIKLSPFEESSGVGAPAVANGLDIIKDIKVRLSVRVGEAELTVQRLFELQEGQVVDLDKQTNEPVDIIVDGHTVARGTLVAVDENFGVRITEVLAQ